MWLSSTPGPTRLLNSSYCVFALPTMLLLARRNMSVPMARASLNERSVEGRCDRVQHLPRSRYGTYSCWRAITSCWLYPGQLKTSTTQINVVSAVSMDHINRFRGTRGSSTRPVSKPCPVRHDAYLSRSPELPRCSAGCDKVLPARGRRGSAAEA